MGWLHFCKHATAASAHFCKHATHCCLCSHLQTRHRCFCSYLQLREQDVKQAEKRVLLHAADAWLNERKERLGALDAIRAQVRVGAFSEH